MTESTIKKTTHTDSTIPDRLKDMLLAAGCDIAETFGAENYSVPGERYDGYFSFIGYGKKLFRKIPVYGEIVANTDKTYPFTNDDIKDISGRIASPKELLRVQNASGICEDFPQDKEIDWGDVIASAVLKLHGYDEIDILDNPPKHIRLYKVILNINDDKDAFISSVYTIDFPMKKAMKLFERNKEERAGHEH